MPNLDDIDPKLVQEFMDQIPFNRLIGIELDELGDGYARMSVPFRKELIGDFMRNVLHGGVLSSLIDTCGGAAAWTRIAADDRVSTVDLRVDYLRPGLPEDVICEAHVLRLGNRVGVVEMTAYNKGKRDAPIASGKGVYNVKRAESVPGDKPEEAPGE